MAGSTEGTISPTRPETVRFRPSISTATLSPIRARPSRDSSIEASRRRLPSRSRVSSGAPGVAKLPGSALRSSDQASEGRCERGVAKGHTRGGNLGFSLAAARLGLPALRDSHFERRFGALEPRLRLIEFLLRNRCLASRS